MQFVNIEKTFTAVGGYSNYHMSIEYVHGGHVGGAKQQNDFPLGNKFYS